ncbi:MAG: hypothetical protein OXE49_15720 [Gemmatimonadetes bacterium]|nr:hypothetical protein [Gemmatimonadota bacterium]
MVELPPEIGLCACCRHVRPVESGRGSVFYLCHRAATDPRLDKYPRLPVHACPCYEQAIATPTM